MPNTTVDITIVYDRFPEFAGKLHQRAGQVVRKTAFDVQRDYQQNTRVDTGAQKNSAYVVTVNSSTYAAASAAAHQLNPEVEILPEVAHPDAFGAIVAVGVSYAAINEFGGTGHVGDGALTQAANNNRQPFLDALNTLLKFQGD